MLILVLIGVYLVFKVTISCEKLHQDNGRSTARYVILWDVVKLYKILEIEVISSPRDNARFYKRCKYKKGVHSQVYLQGRTPFFVFIARQRDMRKTRSVCEWR